VDPARAVPKRRIDLFVIASRPVRGRKRRWRRKAIRRQRGCSASALTSCERWPERDSTTWVTLTSARVARERPLMLGRGGGRLRNLPATVNRSCRGAERGAIPQRG
jgi:hypothetical protein